ncbi:uncharacterized protein LOC129909165 isoform X2 [Episyrphus balteatus]|uniref:uncharacterized protein LOC129909165 isoform X2 n=1 Tax=Episyrphus balteatus TaxID=286459 RepID=UPI002486249C|nr:uncharacterized protein LOC129909165 isoform X2 [Episyrphus balteatus]
MGKHYYKCLACGREESWRSGVKFFRLPENTERLNWLNTIHQPYLIHKPISSDYRVCEIHFSDDMYAISKKRLKQTAKPILNITIDLKSVEKVKKSLVVQKMRDSLEDKDKSEDNQLTSMNKEKAELDKHCHKLEPMKLIVMEKQPPKLPVERYKLKTVQKKMPKTLKTQKHKMSKSNITIIEPSSTISNISLENQMRIVNDHKKIECLEAVVSYTSQMQNIVTEKGDLDSAMQANSHLVSLLDKVVYEWFERAQKCREIGVVTDQLIIKNAQEAKQIFCIQTFTPDFEWLEEFKLKYNITDLDMRLLKIDNSMPPPNLDINEIVLDVLKNNPITEYFSFSTTPTIIETENNMMDNIGTIFEMEEPNKITTEMKGVTSISNDEQAKLHLKPLEEYALLRDNIRAVELISQLMEIFSTEIKKEKT